MATGAALPADPELLSWTDARAVQVVNQRGRALTSCAWSSHDTDSATAVGGRFTP